MTESDAEKFFKWLDEMERIKDLSDRKVAKRGSFSASMLSTYRKEMKVPTSDFCLKIANGLHADQIEALRKAGYHSTPSNYNTEIDYRTL